MSAATVLLNRAARFKTKIADRLVAVLVAVALVFSTWPASVAEAAGDTRSLKIYFVHTGERANIVFKRNGRYDEKGLRALDRLLRDWRRNESRRMDPRLWDLVWDIYQSVGTSEYINAVSGYRAPATNNMLRSRSGGVAKNSQHTLGRALDFYIPGVDLKRIRDTALKKEAGGVGYYPRSGSPFVHVDVAGVRSWPRLSRAELAKLFPGGRTMHIPSDGQPMPGYQLALADYKRRMSGSSFMVANAASGGSSKKRGFLASIFGGGGDEDEDSDAIVAPAPQPRQQKVAPAPAQQQVLTAATEVRNLPGTQVASAPVPASRPAFADPSADGGLASALYAPPRNTAQEAIASVLPGQRPAQANGSNAVNPDLAGMAIPVPTLLGARAAPEHADAVMTAALQPGMPLPSARPSVEENLMAGTEPDEEAAEDAAEQDALSADMVAALNANGADARRDFHAAMEKAASATVIATPAVVPGQKPVEVAALEPRDTARFDAAFTPHEPQTGIAAGLPEKGGRPDRSDADTARRAMTSGTAELNGAKLAQWAFSTQRRPSAATAFKAPRLSAQALAGYDSENRPQQLETARDSFKGNARVLTVNVP